MKIEVGSVLEAAAGRAMRLRLLVPDADRVSADPQLKVLSAIVGPLPVPMVNCLVPGERSAEYLLHDVAVFEHAPAIDVVDQDVPILKLRNELDTTALAVPLDLRTSRSTRPAVLGGRGLCFEIETATSTRVGHV